jgi:hypothetical protein
LRTQKYPEAANLAHDRRLLCGIARRAPDPCQETDCTAKQKTQSTAKGSSKVSVKGSDQGLVQGDGGEAHYTAKTADQTLTTNQGIPSLTTRIRCAAARAGRLCSKVSCCARKDGGGGPWLRQRRIWSSEDIGHTKGAMALLEAAGIFDKADDGSKRHRVWGPRAEAAQPWLI